MPIDIHGVCTLLQVFDMPASLHFYRDLLGFEIIGSNCPNTPEVANRFDWVWLRLNGAEIMLNTAYEADARPPAPDPARVSGHQDICLYFGCPDPDLAWSRLQALGLDAKKPVITHYGMKQVYLADPDGYNLCFQWPAKASADVT
jgi:glyoxylase I family protein